MTERKPVRDAGEVARGVYEAARHDCAVAILTAWRREIETAMVERVADYLEYEEPYSSNTRASVNHTFWAEELAASIRARFGGGE